MLNIISSTPLVASAIVVVAWILTQVLKPAFGNNHYLPLASVVIGGIAGGIVAALAPYSLLNGVVLGLISGFASTGLNETLTKSVSSFVNGLLNGFGKSDGAQAPDETITEDSIGK